MRTDDPPAPPLERARRVAECWAREPDVVGVAVFGSVARGSADAASDTDLLVLCEGDHPDRRELMDRLPAELRSHRFTVLRYERKELAAVMVAGTSFSEHLRRESQVLADRRGDLRDLLALPVTRPVPVEEELQAELARLPASSDFDLFRDNYLFALARVYAVGKAVVMLGLVTKAVPSFDRDEAFREFKRLHPGLAEAVDLVERLRPFYLLVSRRAVVDLPFPYRGSRDEVADSVAAVRALASVVG